MDSDQKNDFDAGFDLEVTDSPAEEAASKTEPEDSLDQGVQESLLSETPAPPDPIAPESQQNAPQIADLPESVSAEFENLQKLNPEAARLAMEDSADGMSIRSRLESYGAEVAQDRAERLLENRMRARREAQARQAQMDAYNRDFQETIRREAPEFYAMANDPKRQAEKQRYFQAIDNWIGNQPYREGQRLMAARQRGSAKEVCDLIKKFEAARTSRRPSDAGMYAAPARGGNYAPAGMGDSDDFNAGWDLNQ